MADKIWIFDLDDTLMFTSGNYTDPINRGCLRIYDALDKKIPLADIKKLRNEIDLILRDKPNPFSKKLPKPPYKYSMERFPMSFVETYKDLCRRFNLNSLYAVENELYKIGLRAYLTPGKYKSQIASEAARILKFLSKKKDILVLCTKGDLRVQRRKLKALKLVGLLKLFYLVRVVPDKDAKVFKQLLKELEIDGKRLFSVGNEYDADIKPAIKVGCFGIYIPVSIWTNKGKLQRIERRRSKARSNSYESLLEIEDKYNSL